MQLVIVDQDSFNKVVESLHLASEPDLDFLYQVYTSSCAIIAQVKDTSLLEHFGSLNPTEHIFYCLGECIYEQQIHSSEEFNTLKKDPKYISSLATMISDKTLSLYFLEYREPKFGNKYLPTISTLEVYLNYFLNTLSSLSQKDPRTTLVVDLLKKSVKLAHTALQLLSEGHETEAFSTWRTLHECECTLVLLQKYGDPLIDSYNRHMEYAIAYRRGYSQEKCDQLFVEIKEKMRSHNYKSKDIKKIIEYGWLFDIPEFSNATENTYRLNFRDGVEKIAGLERYSKIYELSSEIVHSTPMLIYSDDQYFFYLTLINVYESFFRLEDVFTSIFSPKVAPSVMKAYIDFRSVYYPQLEMMHRQTTYFFTMWQKRKNKKSEDK
ncbi:MAG: DUF5677 domain-containing protein [Coprobacillus sp.]|nr:DUF5677 domain-containing protein [Coprobacillus sp.]